VGERKIHIVAAEEEVFADRDALEAKFPAFRRDGDESEVGGPSADVDHQNEVAWGDTFPPIGVALEPGVKGGLRLLKENDVAVAGEVRGLLG
jgi:hypothetical protein